MTLSNRKQRLEAESIATKCWMKSGVLYYTETMVHIYYLLTRVSKDSNAAEHSVDSDIFNAVIHL